MELITLINALMDNGDNCRYNYDSFMNTIRNLDNAILIDMVQETPRCYGRITLQKTDEDFESKYYIYFVHSMFNADQIVVKIIKIDDTFIYNATKEI